MSELNEEEIIKLYKSLLNNAKANWIYEDYEILLNFLDLYQKEKMNSSNLSEQLNKEKEKNKKAIEYMERYEVNSTGKPFRNTEIGKELCEILEERN